MLKYIVRRIVATLPVMAVVGICVFSLLHLTPGDPAAVIAGDQASPEDIAKIRAGLGLDRPFPIQFAEWSGHILRGDLGTSIFTGEPVSHLIAQRVGPTLSLALVTLVMAIVIAIPLGVLAAAKASSWIDQTIMGMAVLGFSVPLFVVGYVLSFVFALKLHWLPAQGYAPLSAGLWPWFSHLLMPGVALGSVYVALIARITRSSLVEVLRQDYIRTARAKGLAHAPILFVHALKNAGIPIVTVVGVGIGTLISGTVLCETVFAIPGMGRLTIDAVMRRDYPIIQGLVLVFSFAYVLVNLLIDLTYVFFDPRVRL